MHLQSCEWCGLNYQVKSPLPVDGFDCPRCHHVVIHKSQKLQFQKGLSASLAGLLAIIPALILPIFRVDMAGSSNKASILESVEVLVENSDLWLIYIILLMMVIVPIVMLMSVFFIHVGLVKSNRLSKLGCAWMRVYMASKEWAMIDVFMLALIVAYVKMADFGSLDILPGTFFIVLVFTCCFISQLYTQESIIWEMANE